MERASIPAGRAALLASIHGALAKARGRIVLTNLSEKVDHVLTVNKCSSIIRHFNSQTEVMAFPSRPKQE